MAAATQRDIYIEGFSGDDANNIVYEMQLTLQNSDGSLMDIDGATSVFSAKRTYTDANAIISISTDDGISVDANASILTMQAKVGDFTGVNLNREEIDLVYDWDMTLDGRKYRLLRGALQIGGDI